MSEPRRDHEALGAGLLTAVRPQLDAAVSTVDGATSAQAAWELCAARGLVPSDWPGESRGAGRVCNDCRGLGVVEGNDGNGWSTGFWHCHGCSDELASGSHEWTVDLVAALAADPEGVIAVEALMREAVSRLAFVPHVRVGNAHWSVIRAKEYYWHMFSTGREMWINSPLELWPLTKMTSAPPDEIARGLERFDRTAQGSTRAYSARFDVAFEACWHELAARGEHFFVSHPNPFTPLVDIWARGYVPAGWSSGGQLYLAAPPLTATPRELVSVGACLTCGSWPDHMDHPKGVERLVPILGSELRRCPACGTYYRLEGHMTRLTPSEALPLLPDAERVELLARWAELMKGLELCRHSLRPHIVEYANRSLVSPATP